MYKFLSIIFAGVFGVMSAGWCETDDTEYEDAAPKTELIHYDSTPCGTRVFREALANALTDVPNDENQELVSERIYKSFESADVLSAVLECTEIDTAAKSDETRPIIFQPITYTFPNSASDSDEPRTITIKYTASPKLIKQRLQLAQRRADIASNPSPAIGDPADPTVWTNTDPAWYAILVTRAGALSQFVGDGNNNVISLQYIEDNINSIIPPLSCARHSALVSEHSTNFLHRAVKETVDQDDDSNGYYVAGDVDLRWISALELAASVVLTVVTAGGGEILVGITKLAQANRIVRRAVAAVRQLLRNSKYVRRFVQVSDRAAQIEKEIKALDNAEDALRQISKLEKEISETTNASRRAKKMEQLAKAQSKYASEIKAAGITPVNEKAVTIANDGAKLKHYDQLLAKQANGKLSKQDKQMLNRLRNQLGKPDEETLDVARKLRTQNEAIEKLEKDKQKLADYNKWKEKWLAKNHNQNPPRFREREMQYLAEDIATQEKDIAERAAQLTMGQIGAESTTEAINAARTQRQQELNTHHSEMKELEKSSDVKTYKEQTEVIENIQKYRHEMKALLHGRRGNILTRAWKTWRATHGKAAELRKAAHTVGRASKMGTRVRDFLFHTTMQHAGRLARLENKGGLLYGALVFIGGMYDYSPTSTSSYTSGIKFKPLGLLSADDLDVPEEVNYGMWLMWTGSSDTAADDDAAYLQAMDFAERLHSSMLYLQQKENQGTDCDMDIYVVRPIIREPGTNEEALYYLIMNEQPWTTKE